MSKKTIIINTNQGIYDLEPHIGKHLKHKGFYVIFMVKTRQDIKFYKKNKLFFYDEIIYKSKKLEHKYNQDSYDRIVYYEKRLKMPIYKIFFTDRTIGRGFFASGGFNHPETKAQKILKHEDLMRLALSKLDFWDNLFTSKNVEYAINLPREAHILAIDRKIHSKRTIIGKFNNTRDWSSNLYYQPDNIIQLYKKSKIKKINKVKLDLPYDAHIRSKKLLVKNFKFTKTLTTSVYFLMQHMYGRVKGNTKSKSIYIMSNFFGHWKIRYDFLRLKKLCNINIESAKKINYIYFPLLTEPEVALHGIATDFFFQLTAINIISRDLPSNYKIIVKEPVLAIGRRPNQFYEQILSLKNVAMADPLEVGLDYIKYAKIVACVTGTSMWEAVALGIPVISFSQNNVVNFLDHVYFLSNFKNSHKVISKIIRKKYPNDKSLKDGALFYKVYNENAINMQNIKEFKNWKSSNVNKKDINVINEMIKSFLKK
ncbi:MAG: hypothetical protein CBB97_02055 [Candidatus Endolissoclinum sp. TMED37]|nr:MAG: hypothetical protein CBB97_02055 [Candidatus Endolissoclinum sp. TMED37]